MTDKLQEAQEQQPQGMAEDTAAEEIANEPSAEDETPAEAETAAEEGVDESEGSDQGEGSTDEGSSQL